MKNCSCNYQKLLDQTIASVTAAQKVPRLFLHSCCGPCSSYVLEYLSEYFQITVFYYNPNISPEEEYRKRVEEQKEFIRRFRAKYPISFVEGECDFGAYYAAVRGLEREPEGGKRCEACFELRLRKTARMAKEAKADYFATTLTISPMKNAELLNRIGQRLGEEYGVAWLFSDFKKKGGYQRSVELSREFGMYRQDYCGCVFSREEREHQKERQEREAASVIRG